VFLSDQACLLRKADSGENNLLLVLFLREGGLKYALARRPTTNRTGPGLPDLFEMGTVTLEQKDPSKPAWLREFASTSRLDDIGRHYRSLKAASQLARFFERNLLHMEKFGPAWQLLEKSLAAMAGKSLPEAGLLKALFLMAREEGYPVVGNWLDLKSDPERTAITGILRSPIGSLEGKVEPDLLWNWIHDLYRFFEQHTDLLAPEH
jgi:recombinational DNA repair protein (RecF pathway)